MTKSITANEAAQIIEQVLQPPTILHRNGQWFHWHDGTWEADDWAAAKLVLDILEENGEAPSRNFVDQTLKLLELREGFSVKAFDTDPFMLAVNNGMLHLPSLTLWNHSAVHYNTRQAGAGCLPGKVTGEPVKFLKFMSEIQSQEMVQYIRWIMKYIITGGNPQQLFFFFHGATGANGKSTLMEIIKKVLGSYMVTVPSSVILNVDAKGAESASPQLMKLNGARLVELEEGSKERKISESLLKSITGGDTISARGLYETPTEFKFTGTLVLVSNYKLNLSGSDNSVWRRIRYVPFPRSISEALRRDKREIVGEIEAELDEILYWAMTCPDEIEIPEEAAEQTALYREDQDELRDFFEECIDVLKDGADPKAYPNFKENQNRLYEALKEWYERAGVAPKYRKGKISFFAYLEERGFKRYQNHADRGFRGISLRGGSKGLKQGDQADLF
jgi:P4 family phage/plasmid primase-like protien